MKVAATWLLLVLGSLSLGQTFPAKPSGTWVADEAHLIAHLDRERIRHDSATLMRSLGAPIVVATISSLRAKHAGKLTIEQYGRKLFDHWGIGSQSNNLGLLLLVSKGDRKVRIEMGADWRNRFDDRAHEIMQSVILPEFKEGHFSSGIRMGADALLRMASEKAPPPVLPAVDAGSASLGGQSNDSALLGLLCCPGTILAILLIVLAIVKGGRGGGPRGGRRIYVDPNDPTQHPAPTYFGGGASGGDGSGGGGFDGGSGGGGGSTGSY